MTFLAETHVLTIYLPHSPLLVFFVGFVGALVLFKLGLALLRSIPL
jgi:hypothetical protein